MTTKDTLFGGKVLVEQPAHGYRFNSDSVLLAEFAAAHVRVAKAAFDLGAGVGAVGLALLHLGAVSHVTMVEKDTRAARLAQANVDANGWEARATVLHADVAELALERADLVVCNPPYVPPGRGRAPSDERALAKQGSLETFLDATRRIAGRRAHACFIYPAIELTTLMIELRKRGLEPKRLQLVHAKAGARAHVAMVDCVAGRPGGLLVVPPRILA